MNVNKAREIGKLVPSVDTGTASGERARVFFDYVRFWAEQSNLAWVSSAAKPSIDATLFALANDDLLMLISHYLTDAAGITLTDVRQRLANDRNVVWS